MRQLEHKAWGEEKCTFCNALVNKDGTLSCKCPSKLVYRKEPAPPASAIRLYYIRGTKHDTWSDAVEAFDCLSADDRKYWDEQAAADRKRFEQEKKAYNDILLLDEEIVTDKEAEEECECGNGWNDVRVALQRRRCEQQWSRYRRDHPRFNMTVKAMDHAVGPGSFDRFIDLPVEVRNQIYTYLFRSLSRSSGLRQWQLEFETDGPDPELRFTHLQPLDTRILATNCQIYAESLDILYSTGCFVVDIARASILPLFIQDPTGTSAPRPTAKIRRWHIQVKFNNSKHKDMILPQLVAVRDVMKQCVRLDEVRFTWLAVPEYWWKELQELVREYDAMLELFKGLHGVGEVVYTDKFSEDGPCRESRWLDASDNLHLASEDVRKAVKASMEASPS
ncbi:MAG: hypothetical protein Q9225_001799 [Loekoesia sp. 1 TL-2023]